MAWFQITQMRDSYANDFRVNDAFFTLNTQMGPESNISAHSLKTGHFYLGKNRTFLLWVDTFYNNP